MRWSVTDRDLHDDLLVSAAPVAVLDRDAAAPYRRSAVIQPPEVW